MPLVAEVGLDTKAYLGESGIVLNETDADGVDWRWMGEEPWSPSPAPREQVGDRVGAHGQWDATEFYGPATRQLRGVAEGGHEAIHRAKVRLMAAVSLRPFTLRITEPGLDRQAKVRRGGEVLWTETSPGSADWSIALYQGDPFIYATDAYGDFTHLPSQSGGLSWPATWPATWDGVVTSGTLSVTNEGTETSYPIFRVYGPLPDFTLSQPATGDLFAMDLAADGETLSEGEWVEVDMKRQRVMLLGQSSRRRSVRGNFFGIPPGEASVLFGSSSYNETAFVECEGRATWI